MMRDRQPSLMKHQRPFLSSFFAVTAHGWLKIFFIEENMLGNYLFHWKCVVRPMALALTICVLLSHVWSFYLSRKFEDIFDVDHFIDYLKDDVRIVRDIPDWVVDKAELFTSIRYTVLNVLAFSITQFSCCLGNLVAVLFFILVDCCQL